MAESAIVIAVASGRCRIFFDGREVDCVIPSEIAKNQRSTLAVGDRVVAEPIEGALWRLTEILPRRTVLSRPDPFNPRVERLIAANIDLVANVVSIKNPPLRPRLIDRFLIATQRGGAQPAICVNKIDLVSDRDDALQPLRIYEELQIPVVACSTKTGEGIDALRTLLTGKTSALVGHSGVGKSSILNALDASLSLATADVHKKGTGRHTTTSSTLFDLGDDTYVIDTPGIREFGLWDVTPEALRESFPEFQEAAEWCRFNDCTHLHEPDCEVKRRLERGEIHRVRYDTYVRLAEDLSRDNH
jgi:ribosome biogenesis GTPase